MNQDDFLDRLEKLAVEMAEFVVITACDTREWLGHPRAEDSFRPIVDAPVKFLKWMRTKRPIRTKPKYKSDCSTNAVIEPPKAAEFLVALFVKQRYRKGLLACLAEDFDNDLASGVGLRRARLRYWGASLNSVAPQLWAGAKRIGLIGIVADYARRLLH